MKKGLHLFVIFSFLFIGCEDDPLPVEAVDRWACDFQLRKYTLSQSSIDVNKYKLGDKVIFVDSNKNELILNVSSVKKSSDDLGLTKMFVYDYKVKGDTAIFCYNADRLEIKLNTSDNIIRLKLGVYPKPYYDDPLSGKFSDYLHVYLFDQLEPFKSSGVFETIIDKKNNPDILNFTKTISELTIYGKTFKDVMYNEFANAKNYLWYTMSEGIIAFTDHDGKKWRYDRTEK